jgi:hypothetical protein
MRTPTPKERVLAALTFGETDIVPYDVAIEPEVEERLNEHYGGTAWENMLQKHFINVAFPSEYEELLDHILELQFAMVDTTVRICGCGAALAPSRFSRSAPRRTFEKRYAA